MSIITLQNPVVCKCGTNHRDTSKLIYTRSTQNKGRVTCKPCGRRIYGAYCYMIKNFRGDYILIE